MSTRQVRAGGPLWLWFCGWAVAGAGFCTCALVLLSVGWFALSAPVIVAILLASYQPSARAAFGLVTGVGAPLLYEAYANRSGPGLVCATLASGYKCTHHTNPILWLVPGALCVVVGVVAAVAVRGRPHRTSLR